jgi:Domain of unknown function (DUF4276)
VSVRRLLILVEGQTEERFVAELLRDHLLGHDVFVRAKILVTRRDPGGAPHKGGVRSWSQIRHDLTDLLGDSNAAGVTTLIDYYALPEDVPGMADRPSGPAVARVRHVEAAISADLRDRRLRPFLMLHEYEAMLFTDIACWQDWFEDAPIAALKRDVQGLLPENINETPAGAPSKRIGRYLPDYDKVLHGPDAVRDIGLAAIRAACPHFADWLAWAEAQGAHSAP